MPLSEYAIIETCKEALQDLRDTYPDEPFPSWHQLRFKVDRGTRRNGVCKHRYNHLTGQYEAFQISLSQYHSERFHVDNCFRHEMAHWMAGYEEGDSHGPKWQAWAVKCGTTPDRCNDRELDVPVKPGYTIYCTIGGCEWKKVFQRKARALTYPHAYKCPNCGHAQLSVK